MESHFSPTKQAKPNTVKNVEQQIMSHKAKGDRMIGLPGKQHGIVIDKNVHCDQQS